jgi:hypothetical protein
MDAAGAAVIGLFLATLLLLGWFFLVASHHLA